MIFGVESQSRASAERSSHLFLVLFFSSFFFFFFSVLSVVSSFVFFFCHFHFFFIFFPFFTLRPFPLHQFFRHIQSRPTFSHVPCGTWTCDVERGISWWCLVQWVRRTLMVCGILGTQSADAQGADPRTGDFLDRIVRLVKRPSAGSAVSRKGHRELQALKNV